MKASVRKRLQREVDAWAVENRALIAASRRLVEYFGTRKELVSWDGALKLPLACVSAVVTQFEGEDPKLVRVYREGVEFRCSESTARVVSPLAEILGGPIAEFVYTIRRIVPRAEHSRHLRPYGDFIYSFADAVTQPLWRTYRHLAPQQWKDVFPARRRR